MKRNADGEYEYRAYTIFRDTSVTAGYWGAWKVQCGSRTQGRETLKSAKQLVDQMIVEIESKQRQEDTCETS